MIAQWFSAALTDWHTGRVAEAEQICRHILVIDAGHTQTLHLLGLIEHQRGRSDSAIEHTRNAIMPNRWDPVFHYNLGNILRERASSPAQ